MLPSKDRRNRLLIKFDRGTRYDGVITYDLKIACNKLYSLHQLRQSLLPSL